MTEMLHFDGTTLPTREFVARTAMRHTWDTPSSLALVPLGTLC
ncbi:hypothetical protein [Streptomyces tubercidicus]